MLMSKQFKFQPNPSEFGSKGVWVQVSNEELGIASPTNPEEVRDVAKKMSMHLEALIILEEVRYGRIEPEKVTETLKPWLPAQTPSPTS